MEDMSLPWFKFWSGEYLSDPKTRNFTAEQHSCWFHLLCFATNSSTPGVIKHLSEEALLGYAGALRSVTNRNEAYNAGVLSLFKSLGMIDYDTETITVLNWDKRQQTALTNAERQKQYRDRKRNDRYNDSNARIDKNRIDTVRANAKAITIESDKPTKRRKTTPEMQLVFDLFRQNSARLAWRLYPVQREAAEILYREYGLEELEKRYAIAQKHRNEPMCPQIDTPKDFLDKMPNMERFLKNL